jgi:hypothetical protein
MGQRARRIRMMIRRMALESTERKGDIGEGMESGGL